jgi:predicted N-formylglutamate amidohydrolase
MRDGHADAAQDWPDPVEVLNELGRSPVVLVCEHASNHIPAKYDGLGLSGDALEAHIAWDIGAAAVTRHLSRLLDAPAFLATYSRLLIDLNRPPHVASAVPKRSERTDIPGNRDLPAGEARRRVRSIFNPYHARIQAHLDERQTAGRPTCVISIHSFTPVFEDVDRPWHAGILFGQSEAEGEQIARALETDPDLVIGRNEPYRIEPDSDYCVLVHGEARGLPAVLVEIRNDGLSSPAEISAWADRLAAAITRCTADAA